MRFDTHSSDAETTTQATPSRNNPVLEFVLNVAETAKYVWVCYLEWIIDVSWGKAFLAGLLSLILGGMFQISSFANLLVLGSLLLKCFIGKESETDVQSEAKPEIKPDEQIDRPEES